MRVLLIEDQPADAELTLRNLQSNGIDCGVERVDTEVALRRALLNAPALIISDAQLPGFDAESALAIARELAPRIPFIVFSGAPWITERKRYWQLAPPTTCARQTRAHWHQPCGAHSLCFPTAEAEALSSQPRVRSGILRRSAPGFRCAAARSLLPQRPNRQTQAERRKQRSECIEARIAFFGQRAIQGLPAETAALGQRIHAPQRVGKRAKRDGHRSGVTASEHVLDIRRNRCVASQVVRRAKRRASCRILSNSPPAKTQATEARTVRVRDETKGLADAKQSLARDFATITSGGV